MSICKKCGATIKSNYLFCPECGQNLISRENAVICLECNTANPAGTRFCKGCGAVLIKREPTIKCVVCGSDNSPDALFCSTCGSEIPGEKKIEFESESIEKLKKLIPAIQAYRDAKMPFSGASKAEIVEMTYVCPICGKVNSNEDEKCTRCGRDRKRTAELAMKRRIKTFEEAIPIPDRSYKPFKPKKIDEYINQKNTKNEYKCGKRAANTVPYYNQNGMGNMGGSFGSDQMSPIVQPIAIVPYVSQEQPLWQIASTDEIANVNEVLSPMDND